MIALMALLGWLVSACCFFALFAAYWEDGRTLIAVFMLIALVAALGNAFVVYHHR
jgi:hypothetical protein